MQTPVQSLGALLKSAGDIMRQDNVTLFSDGVCAHIKEDLLKEFNLHPIVRWPNDVFAPYTGIPSPCFPGCCPFPLAPTLRRFLIKLQLLKRVRFGRREPWNDAGQPRH